MKTIWKFVKKHWIVTLLIVVAIVASIFWVQSVRNLIHSSIWSKPIYKLTYGEIVVTFAVLLFIFRK